MGMSRAWVARSVIAGLVVVLLPATGCGFVLGSQGADKTAKRNFAPVDNGPGTPMVGAPGARPGGGAGSTADPTTIGEGGDAAADIDADGDGQPDGTTTTTTSVISTNPVLGGGPGPAAGGGTGSGGSPGSGATNSPTNSPADRPTDTSAETAIVTTSDLCRVAWELGVVGSSLKAEPTSLGSAGPDGGPDPAVDRVLETFSRLLQLLPAELKQRFAGLIKQNENLAKSLSGDASKAASKQLPQLFAANRDDIVELVTTIGKGCPAVLHLVPDA